MPIPSHTHPFNPPHERATQSRTLQNLLLENISDARLVVLTIYVYRISKARTTNVSMQL